MRLYDVTISEHHLPRNPGTMMLWITHGYSLVREVNPPLFSIGPPVEVQWYCEGRTATRAEVLASIEGGLPKLRASAEAEDATTDVAVMRRRGSAVEAIERGVAMTMLLVPQA